MAAVTMAKRVISKKNKNIFFSFTLEHIWAKYLIPIFKIAKIDLLGRPPTLKFIEDQSWMNEEQRHLLKCNFRRKRVPFL